MKYLHSTVRERNLDGLLRSCCNIFGLKQVRRLDNEHDQLTLDFPAAAGGFRRASAKEACELELTHNWSCTKDSVNAQNLDHLAYQVCDIYASCCDLMAEGITVTGPPCDGRMSFILSPDKFSIQFLQSGEPLAAAEAWTSMQNRGSWS
jgi:lactoylglutathione lyase